MNFSDPTRRLVFLRVSIQAFLVLSTLLLISAGAWEEAGAATLYNLYDLGTINGDSNSFAVVINNSGQIAGFTTVTADVPVFWTNYSSATFELSQAGATFRANGLNNAGQIVGGTTDNQARATFWTNSASPAFYLDASGQPRSEADAINSAGEIVGRFSTLGTVSGAGRIILASGPTSAVRCRRWIISEAPMATGPLTPSMIPARSWAIPAPLK